MTGKFNPSEQTSNRRTSTCLRRAEQIMREHLLETMMNFSNFRPNLFTQSNGIGLIIICAHKTLYIVHAYSNQRAGQGLSVFTYHFNRRWEFPV